MSQPSLIDRLAILADAAKYDASCASSGTAKRNSKGGKGIGSTEGSGICHAYAPDGRCISLLKILLTNHCVFDCHYCINRKSSNVRRARFTPQEVVDLTLNFYRRNYIEGLFLSSGIIKSSNHTMEQLIEIARILREEHDFRGYIHLKTIPEADPELIELAGRYADRVSINVELPTDAGLVRLAPDKSARQIEHAMGDVKAAIIENKDAMLRGGLFAQGEAFVGDEATLETLRARASRADVVHLACHAQFRSDNPRFSALHLHDGEIGRAHV